MKRWVVYGTVIFLGAITTIGLHSPVKQTTLSDGAASTSMAQVAKVIDGDTIELADGRRVRYIGMDAPETAHGKKPASCFGYEAAAENRRLVEGKTVKLVKDVSETDTYGRLLRFVYVDDVFMNDYLIRQGFARIDTVPPDFAHREEFFTSEQEAMGKGRGLWGGCY